MGDRWIKTREAEIILHAPGFWSIAVSKFVPKSFTNLLCVGNYDAENLAAADQSVVPAEVVIEDEFEAFSTTAPSSRTIIFSRAKFPSTSVTGMVC